MGFLAGAGQASADGEAPQHQGGAVATLDGLKTYDTAVLHADGKDQELAAGLFEMTVDGGGRLKTYCIDIHNPTQEQAKYLETSWDQTSLGANKNAGKIRWILEHSYPQVDNLAALAHDARTGPLTDGTAAAGTQVAIWRYSDHADVDAGDPQAEKLADWLRKTARNVAEPRASLAVEPAAVSGKPGGKLGPVTVRTDADHVTVAPSADALARGVRVTDKDGKPVTSAVNGTQLYFDVPSASSSGSAALGLQATTSVPVGRAFAGVARSQTQILAGSSDSTVSATATANWARSGAIPALTAKKDCARGGVGIAATNQGDKAFTFELAGGEHTVMPGESRTITVPVDEDQAYDLTIRGPAGFSRTFRGVLDCETAGTYVPPSGGPSPQLGVAPADGSSPGTDNLAETGSSSATPVIAGIAIALVMIGGAAVFFLRGKNSSTGE
jgi:TQXA domain-containing protein/LPXTG-motif cell wall-anchored protein